MTRAQDSAWCIDEAAMEASTSSSFSIATPEQSTKANQPSKALDEDSASTVDPDSGSDASGEVDHAGVSLDVGSPGSVTTDVTSFTTCDQDDCLRSCSTLASPQDSSEIRMAHRADVTKARALNPFAAIRDLQILACMLDLCRLPHVDDDVARLLLRTIEMLHRCRYCVEDVCSIVAHAAVYFDDVYGQRGPHMDAAEAGNVLVLAMFVAHTYVQDETCPLSTWHRFLFKDYCTVGELNSAVLRVLQLRGYMLRVEESKLQGHYNLLCKSSRLE